MTCPDDLQLDAWLDRALPNPDAAAVARHLAICAPCAARRDVRLAEERVWQAALALDAGELAHLARADLAAAWRGAPGVAAGGALAPARWWAALVLLAAVAAYGAWATALPVVTEGAGWLSRLGLAGIALGWLLSQGWEGALALGSAADDLLLGQAALWLTAAGVALWIYLARLWERPVRYGTGADC